MKILLLTIVVLIFQESIAQDPQLIENTWYLEHITVDTVQINAPSNDEVSFVDLVFITNDEFNTNVCNFGQGQVVFISGEDFFEITDMVISLIDCENQENSQFEIDYFYGFFNFDSGLDNPFQYEITQGTGDSKQLLLTSSAGNTATYNNAVLSITEQKTTAISIHPNPFSAKLEISATTALKNVKVYTALGQEVAQKVFKNGTTTVSLDLAFLKSGVYFATLEDAQGNRGIKRLVKE